MDTNEIHDHVAQLTAGEYLDYDTYYVGGENNLFSEDEDTKAVTRTFAVDEDQLAALVEQQLKIEAINGQIEEVTILADKISARLELARTNYDKRLPKEVYFRGINKLVELVGSKKLGKGGKLQALVQERRTLVKERDAQMASDRSALWAAWYQINDQEQFFQDYLEKPLGPTGWDSKEYDNQDHLTDDSAAIECLGDEHVLEMIAGEGLVWQDQKPVKENPYLPRDWYDFGRAKRMENEARQDQAMAQEDEAFFASIENEEPTEEFVSAYVGD